MRHSFFLCITGLSLVVLAACEDGEPTSIIADGGTGPMTDAALDAAADTGTPAQMCPSGPTQPCTCDGGTAGVMYCNAALGTYSECACSTTPGIGQKCKAGYYTGTFEGDWRPGAFDLGGGLTLVTANIEAMGTADKPGLAITLDEKVVEAGEFTYREVENGCVTGTATSAGFDSHPFVASISGKLDCATGEFDGVMDGYYHLFDLGELSVWEFSGPMLGTFNPDTASIDQGTWDLREKQAKPNEDPGAGGEGTWNAAWQSDESPPLPPECEALLNGQVGADAGVSMGDGGTDAGAEAGADAAP